VKRYRFERAAEQDRELDEAGALEREREGKVRRVSPGKLSRSSQLGHAVHRNLAAAPVSPGKRAPTGRMPALAPEQVSVQHRRDRAAGVDEEEELEIAARGVTDLGGPLPYFEELQRAFGRHDLKDIRAATGGEAGRANQRMGSVAYAMGHAVAFRDSSPDLFTVAHEAAHVIQQRAGAVATGTVGQSGDRHEAHADAVAERVVRGQSAEDLLDQVAPGASRVTAPSGPASVQRLDDEDYQGMSTVQAVMRALLDDEADDALTLMRRLDGAGEANVVLNSSQSLATRCFGNSEIAEAAGILVGRGGSLSRALDWMYDEGTDWFAVLDVISCATPSQRSAIKTDAWRAHFVGELGESQMSDLVDLLGLSLYDKLDWMSQVGVDDWSAIRSKIVAAPAAERAELVSNGWRDWFVDDVVDDEEMSELVDLLGMDLATKLDWMYEEGTDWSAVRSKIVAAPAEERAALVADGWRDWFAEDVVDGEGMSELVDLLGMDLVGKLHWLFVEQAEDWIVLSKIDAAAPDEKAALVTDAWRDRFIEELDAESIYLLVGILGMDLVSKLQWLLAVEAGESIIEPAIASAPEAERVLVVTDAWRDRFVEVFDQESMPRLVDLLDMTLSSKLDWMWRVGTSWSAVRSKIVAAPPDQRLALVTDEWRDWFADDVVDNEEMSELVDLIGMPLANKLDWLRVEGSDYQAIIGKVVTAPAAERPAVYDSDLREFFVKHCSDEEMAVVVILLGGTLVQQLSWMAAEGSRADLVLDRVNAAPPADRPALHDDSAVLEMIRDFEPRERIPIIEAAGGTPAQQMDLFGAETHIRLLTWATPSADWVDALMTRESPLDLLEVAKGDPAGWGPFIRPKLWDLLATHEDTLYPEERVAVFWEAYGTGMLFTADQILHFFKLLFGREIRPASEDIIVSTGETTRTRFSVVAPTDDTARAFMDCVRPGGGGPTGIGRAEVGTGTIAFCTHEHKEELSSAGWNTVSTEVVGSQYWMGYVIIKAVGSNPNVLQPGVLSTKLIGAATDGTPDTVGTGLNYFQNHVRHEIGHAIGGKAIGDMSQSGNAFAEKYGDWQVSSESAFLAAMWSGQSQPATGWPSLAIGAASVTVSDDEVRDWCIGVISSGKEASNALGNAPGTFDQKKLALAGSIWSGEKMVALLGAIPVSQAAAVPGDAYYFPGFVPPSPVPIFASRWGDRFVTYSTEAYNAFTGISWYARSSPAEMFAEMYTCRYGGGTLPPATSTGDPDAFFTELEQQRDPMFGAPPPELVDSGR
jgi:hypothetical protein